jgi:hypothetical protein
MKNHLQPQITEHKKRTTKYCTENPGPGLGWAQKHGKWDPNPPNLNPTELELDF